MVSSAVLGIAAQLGMRLDANGESASDPRPVITVLDATPPDDEQAETIGSTLRRVAEACGVEARVGGPRDATELLGLLDAERARRESEDDTAAPMSVLVLFGLQRLRALRKTDDDFSFSFSEDSDSERSAGSMLSDLLRDGPPLGMHTIAWCDTFASLNRTVDRRAVEAFEFRALMQMSAADSSALIDSPAAARVGPNRVLLYNDETGDVEKFRPYKVPAEATVEAVLARRAGRS